MAGRGDELNAEAAEVPANGSEHVGIGLAGVAAAGTDLAEAQRTSEELAQLFVEGGGEPDWSAIESAGPILMRLARLEDVVRAAAAHCEPSELSNYLLALARELNSWYVEHRVLGEAPGVTAARLGLIRASKSVLGNGLGLLGITALEAM